MDLASAAWKRAHTPVTLGPALSLNIPACAAPILCGLLGLTATTAAIVHRILDDVSVWPLSITIAGSIFCYSQTRY